ncbi:metal ABC transporter ATP-binding protein [Oscillochloris sp. ZM17-4]|uniref:metal ABC transporter ATP-binding protein n=1 Tax=Oscillochloris sp. ZM17-4 TaxID=2866714 RepID=UPI001C732FDC|nr:metal ABC transporter ATP-binding protein [Oscillochloris sp. ZM17-4]MBX0328173.1 metal ABC transporter ATP-binding protein [Oscillochloris sp. ZM17-4]
MALLRAVERPETMIKLAPALEICGLSVSYGAGLALEGVSCALREGEQVAVVGPNGAGKSSLFKAIVGLLRPSAGSIRHFGAEQADPSSVAYVPQRSQVDWRFPVSVADVVMMGRVGRVGLFRRPGARDRALVAEALELVRMTDLARRQISELSGGQQQRVFLARALAQEARLLLMDEPLTGLDARSQDEIFQIMEDLRPRRVTVLTALHDLQLAARHFDRVMLLNRRLIGFGPAAEVFAPDRLVEAYGGHLHLAVTREGILTVADTCCGDEM